MTDMLVKLYRLPEPPPRPLPGTVIRRALAPERPAVVRWVRRQFGSRWAAECKTAFGCLPVRCFVVLVDRSLAGFCVYDCTARGMLGPIGLDPAHRGRGLGRELLRTTLTAMRSAGYAYAVIGWVAAEAFFRRAVGAIPIPQSTPGFYADLVVTPEE
jgi:GNAT superfamily N-acetyltransferase